MSKYFYFNWKSNPESLETANQLCKKYVEIANSNSISFKIFPPSILISSWEKSGLPINFIGLQNISDSNSGAFTGEISALLAKSLNLKTALIGHSETRERQKLTNQNILSKVERCLENEIIPVLCVGYDPKNLGDGADFEKVLLDEITYYFDNLSSTFLNTVNQIETEIVIAYEPVWAIGSGKSASLEHINHILSKIKSISQKYPGFLNVKFLYGGSVNSSSVSQYLESSDIDGFLIGGSSLKISELESFENTLTK